MYSGNLFHTSGAALEKDLSPNVFKNGRKFGWTESVYLIGVSTIIVYDLIFCDDLL